MSLIYVEMADLSKGDFVYQSDQELFLVAIDASEESYTFVVHGWREIGKDRLDEYLDHQNGKLFSEEELQSLVDEEGDDTDKQNFGQLLDLLEPYKDINVEDEQMIEDYAFEDK